MGVVVDSYRFAAGGPFTPTDLTGCTLWLDAADTDTITIATGVSQWDDKSATATALTQADTSKQPKLGTVTLNGIDIISTDGTDWLGITTGAIGYPEPLTVFCVMHYSTGDCHGFSAANGGAAVYVNSSNVKMDRQGSANLVVEGVSTGVDLIVSAVFGTSASELFVNGVSGGTGADPSLSAGAGVGVLAGRPNGSFPSTNGAAVAEVIVYNTALNSTDRATVETYLNDKWSVY